ncbi:hypothetical protein NUW58_g6585 [Xylaria curta]|uniref:Uncharacterized protein n=1 Tax=Xylaria curta TaxID=42375 RepID=A0ACC1NU50_9PEZI|nr:hypothetical protein NUW58_g6585 [Xylaria curta]
MKAERVSPGLSFKFLGYEPQVRTTQVESAFTPKPDLHVTQNAFWSYCGPLLTASEDLPPNFHEWASAALSGSLLPRLIPFLEFVNEVLREHELDHYWLTIRATKATSEFDKPRWHTDDVFYDWYTHTRVEGTGASITVSDVPWTRIPLFLRGGVVFPVRAESALTTTALRTKPFELIVAVGRDGRASGSLHVDDGISIVQRRITELK